MQAIYTVEFCLSIPYNKKTTLFEEERHKRMNLLKKLMEPVDMTEGSPWQKIVLFTVPMLIGNIAQQLYNTVDSVVVGNYVGDNALAAVRYLTC